MLPVLDKHISHLPALNRQASSKYGAVLCADNVSSSSFISESTGLSSRLSYKDYLRYFLYGGMVYTALKNWRKASHFFGIVISMPTVGTISMVMVEAYKKWVLVGLLEKGKVSYNFSPQPYLCHTRLTGHQLCSPPKITASHVAKMYQSLARPYVTLAHTFERGDIKTLEAEVNAARDIWCTVSSLHSFSSLCHVFLSC